MKDANSEKKKAAGGPLEFATNNGELCLVLQYDRK